MMDYEPITKGLREYIRDNTPRNGNCWWQPEDTKAVIACCDSIDAIQRSLEQENERLRNASGCGYDYDVGYKAGHAAGFDEGFAIADDWCAKHEDAMAEHGWYRALDADEKPISIDDAVEHNGVVANVLGITFHGTTPPTVCICRGDCWVEADTLHHHRPDTWESIIEDAMRAGRTDVTVDVMPLIKRCKALAGESE